MDLSVVICTRNREEQLRRCLRRLADLRSRYRWEIVMVNNGANDNTADVLKLYQRMSRQRFVVVDEPKPGLGRARNTGWRAAAAPVAAFIDDDCYPAEDYLDSVVECFREAEIGYLGGRILLHDPTDLPVTLQELGQRVDFPAGGFIPLGMIQGANLSIRRRALEDIGGFDPRLGAGTRYPSEDIDIVARLSAHGWTGAFDPRPVIYHHHGRKTSREAFRLQCGYAVGGGAYYCKCLMNPKLRRLYLRKWLRQMPHQLWLRTVLELWGAICFFPRSLLKTGR